MAADFLFSVGAWARFAFRARSWRLTHPPHLYALFEAMQKPARHPDMAALRRAFRTDRTPLEAPDAGAGSRSSGDRTVAHVARTALKSPKEAGQMARMVEVLRADHVLELGTCLGLTSATLARAGAAVITIEADPQLAALAAAGWRELGVQVRGEGGTFADRLPELEREWQAAGHPGFGLIFIDGHHDGAALVDYVRRLRPWLAASEGPAAIVCDDIRWSPSMWAAWNALQGEWPVAVDLGTWGLLMDGPRLTPFRRAVRL